MLAKFQLVINDEVVRTSTRFHLSSAYSNFQDGVTHREAQVRMEQNDFIQKMFKFYPSLPQKAFSIFLVIESDGVKNFDFDLGIINPIT